MYESHDSRFSSCGTFLRKLHWNALALVSDSDGGEGKFVGHITSSRISACPQLVLMSVGKIHEDEG
jgi:hypothetical protein